ncbi:DUF433 domain-containing protein [Tardiphaga sp.]|uniref:DUF433 domain-containing protein n=1 Tax=Tardiphaga sp. TaxID=1926292 RepID=UPI0025E93B60|nr:DUF433 domain-containing protein [Tardiphaga sp.]
MSVEFIIGVMADGWSVADILANYPHITATTSRPVCAMFARLCAPIAVPCEGSCTRSVMVRSKSSSRSRTTPWRSD